MLINWHLMARERMPRLPEILSSSGVTCAVNARPRNRRMAFSPPGPTLSLPKVEAEIRWIAVDPPLADSADRALIAEMGTYVHSESSLPGMKIRS
jgi:hypothetical protein